VIGQRGHDDGALRGLLLLVVLVVALVAAPQAQAAPVVTYSCSPAPTNCAGWFRSNVTVTWTVTPPEAATEGCAPVTFTTDTPGVVATCRVGKAKVQKPKPPKVHEPPKVHKPKPPKVHKPPKAHKPPKVHKPPKGHGKAKVTGRVGKGQVIGRVTIKLDKTPPTVTGAGAMRAADVNGWYNHPVRLAVTATDATSGLADCPRVVRFAGPDSAAPLLAGICTDVAGNRSPPFTLGLKYDATDPLVTGAIPERPPDHAGWFSSAIRFHFSGADATSGVAQCGSASYAGPDTAAASILGTCEDQAGNVSRRAFTVMFDATPPRISGLTATPGDRRVALQWQSDSQPTSAEILRVPGYGSEPASVVFAGPGTSFSDAQVDNGVRYVYRVRLADAAGNTTSQAVAAVPSGPTLDRLLSPAANATVTTRRPPLLTWMPVPRARYYNVQLFRGARKVLSAWPARPRYQVKKRWTRLGRPQRLRPGRYRWFVWPGFGPRAKVRYGDLLGRRAFTVLGR
jgi:hypothetical protein